MFPQPRTEAQSDLATGAFLTRVPPQARRILLVGCGQGRLGRALKAHDPSRQVIGVETDQRAAAVARRRRLDEVYDTDLECEPVPLPDGSVDCIIFDHSLERFVNPERVLRRLRPVLAPEGVVLAAVANAAHWSVLVALLRSDLQYQPVGPLDSGSLRLFTHATVFKLFLDAGLLPNRLGAITEPVDDQFAVAAEPLLARVRMDSRRGRAYLETRSHLVSGRLLPEPSEQFADTPITFVACVNDEGQLDGNLLRSPCLAPGSPHEVLLMRGQTSAAAGFNTALDQAKHEIVVVIQQDMYLPRGWDHTFQAAFAEAERKFPPLGVAGAYGVIYRDGSPRHVGRVVDRNRLLERSIDLPARVDGLDEIVLGMRRDSPLRFEESVGFHLYGADICLSAHQLGLSSVALDIPAYHNSLFSGLSAAYYAAREALLAKWPEPRPLYVNQGRLDTMTAADAAVT